MGSRVETPNIMITTKKSINAGVKSMGAKAMSWNQVCKSLSGIGGYKTDVVVNPVNILRGLQQSVYITATMDKITKSAEKCAALKAGWVNMGDRKAEKWVRVAKLVNGSWAIAAEKKEVASNAKKAAAGTKKSAEKKGNRKAA